MKRFVSIVLMMALLLSFVAIAPPSSVSAANKATTSTITVATEAEQELLDDLMEQYTSFIVVKHQQLGGSHYAYTEAVSDSYDSGAPNGDEVGFKPGSQMILVELEKDGDSVTKTETVLINSTSGVIRDPDVSEDGTKVLFSWKKAEKTDDYHLYEYDLITNETRQLTFGLGVADTEPKYLPNGNIVFSSTRCIQTVDCWKTPVSNLYICGPNGEDIVRVGYDQVHTTYPTVTDDGRVIYTRWDYNDRTQMYVQSLFQMFPDGTNQTELFGNNSNFPTTLLHTRQVVGASDKYISIAAGHHTRQAGSLVMIDTSKGRNSEDAVTFILPDRGADAGNTTIKYNSDWNCQDGALYKYPYSISENQFLVACDPSGWDDANGWVATFNIYVMDTDGNKVELVSGKNISASQIVPVATRQMFERASMVNYASNTGTYYIGNIYEGDGLKGVEVGTAKYLRVVALDYRSYAIGDTYAKGTGTADPYSPISTGNGSWDVKRVLGIVPIEADGSALFKVPSETPIYFQVLDAEGQMIQSMRSWSTLMPGETFSCVGCHEDKNTVPPATSTTTMAMAKGVQELQPDFWQTGEGYEDFDPYTTTKGFDYLEEIQTIWDASCVECHNNAMVSYDMINVYDMDGIESMLEDIKSEEPIANDSTWQYFKSNNLADVPSDWNTLAFSGNWSTAKAPFGNDNNLGYNTLWNDTSYIWLRQEFVIDDLSDYKNVTAMLKMYYDDLPNVYLNGHQIYSATAWCGGSYVTVKVENVAQYLLEGTNVLAIRCQDTGGNRMIASNLSFAWMQGLEKESITLLDKGSEGWSYVINQEPADNWMNIDFNDSAWKVGQSGFGNRGGQHTSWSNGTIWLRKDFTITKEQLDKIKASNMRLSLDIFYDEDPVIYLNGVEIFRKSGWVDAFTTFELARDAADLLKVGTNVLAIQVANAGGGAYIDVALTAIESFGSDFSLEGTGINSPQMKKDFPLSYLVLTGSKPSNFNNESEWLGDSDNDFTNWISCMSQCEMLDPYQYGSTKSYLVQMLKEEHHGVKLTDTQLRTIMAWIDLAVPCYGDYASGNTWDANAQRWADECDNKREYYVTMNELARQSRALGAEAVKQDISISFKISTKVYDEAVDFSGAKRLEVPYYYITRGTQITGGVLTVTLPEGEHYLGLTLDSRMGEAIIYVPDGTYTFTVPSDLTPYNRTFTNNTPKTITARVVSMDELNERHNLAENPYDLTDLSNKTNLTGGYPHATTNSNYGNSSEFIVRNAIDGVAANKGHGGYPTQSWGPDQGAGKWMQVDFGREVYIDEIVLALRADFPHDTYFKSGTLEFSDGTKININLEQTADKQSFTFAPIKTTYVKLTNLVAVNKDGDDWAAITEFEAYGTESKVQ